MKPIYGTEALRRYREQHSVVDTAARCPPDGDAVVVRDDEDSDDFDELFDAWVDHNMEVFG